MQLKMRSNDIRAYLSSSSVIDFDKPLISMLARQFRDKARTKLSMVESIYLFVRDEIHHSADIQSKTISCSAYETLVSKEGICFAKANLLAALLRYNNVPAGFCYQRLRLKENNSASPLILHGLNGVYIKEIQKWVRLDARGNKKGVNAQFSIDTENEELAFMPRLEYGEEDIPYIFAEQDRNIIKALQTYKTFQELWRNLPSVLALE